jgi:hypothetical protein
MARSGGTGCDRCLAGVHDPVAYRVLWTAVSRRLTRGEMNECNSYTGTEERASYFELLSPSSDFWRM